LPGALACAVIGAWCANAPTASAATVEDLYSFVVEQDPQARNPRSDAIARAMARVLVRVTGSSAAATAPELRPLIQDAEQSYLNSYAVLEGREVRVGFIARNVDEALERLNWPVWGSERPATMFFIAIELETGERAIVSTGGFDTGFEHSLEMQDRIAALREELDAASLARAVPYILPERDLDDMLAADFADVWRSSYDVLEAAAARYAADAIVVGRLRDDYLVTEADWTLYSGSDQRYLVGTTLTDVVNSLADQYAAEFSSFGGSRPIDLRISGIEQLSDYGRVLNYLDSVSIVERVDVSGFRDGVLTLSVQSRADADVLSRVLQLNELLIPARRPGAPPSGRSLDFEIAANSPLR
jgi:hypothetical protein